MFFSVSELISCALLFYKNAALFSNNGPQPLRNTAVVAGGLFYCKVGVYPIQHLRLQVPGLLFWGVQVRIFSAAW